jgi:hypothetical protein
MPQDAVQKYGGASNATIAFFESDLVAMIRGRGNHPSIVQWETFNEDDCWKVFVTKPHTVAEVVQLARRTDWQGRPVDTDSGGGDDYDEAGDVNDIHSYPYPGDPIPSPNKYATTRSDARRARRNACAHHGARFFAPHRYAMLGEFGGIGSFTLDKEWVPGGCYTYLHVNTSQLVADTYINMTETMIREQVRRRGLVSTLSP